MSVIFSALQQSEAATYTWIGTGANGAWSTADNFSPGTPFTSTDDLVFTGIGYLPTNNHDAASGTAANSITFASNAGAFSLNGAALTLHGGIKNTSSNVQTINLAGLTLSGAQTIDAGTSGIVINSPIVMDGPASTEGVFLTIKGDAPSTINGAISSANGVGRTVDIEGFVEMGPLIPLGLAIGFGGGATAVNLPSFAKALKLTGTNTYSGLTHIGVLQSANRFTAVEFNSLGNFGSSSILLGRAALRWAPGNTADISSRFPVLPIPVPTVIYNPDGTYAGKSESVTAPFVSNAAFDTNGNDVTFGTAFGALGIVAKMGAGTLSLNSRSFLTSALITEGTLEFNGAGAGNVSDRGIVGDATLTGNGQLLIRNGANMEIVGISNGGTVTIRQGSNVRVDQLASTGVEAGSNGSLVVDSSNFRAGFGLIVGGAGTGNVVFQNSQITAGNAVSTPTAPGFDPNNPSLESIFLQLFGLSSLIPQNIMCIGGNPGTFSESPLFDSVLGVASPFNSIFGNFGLKANSGGTGTLTVKSGTVMNVLSQINVGYSGTGTLNIESGSKVYTADGLIGGDRDSSVILDVEGQTVEIVTKRGASGTGVATVNQALWGVGGELIVGTRGSGTLQIKNGGEVYSINTYVGFQYQGNGTLTVTDPTSRLMISENLRVGGSEDASVYYRGDISDLSNLEESLPDNAGVGNVSVLNGGLISVQGNTSIGLRNAEGTATVSGGGVITITGNFDVGLFGKGTVNIGAGGQLSNQIGSIGTNAGAVGTMNLTGGIWNNRGNLYVGKAGTGTVSFGLGNLSFVDGDTSIGTEAGSRGTVNVPGGNWKNENALVVGDSGVGIMNLTVGGLVKSFSGVIGKASTGGGAVEVNDSGWNITDKLIVGERGLATLAIKNGGFVNNMDGVLGSLAGGSGLVTVDGALSSWANTGNLFIGDAGAGGVTISNGAKVTVSGYTEIARTNGITGSVSVSSGTWTNTGNFSVGTRGTGTVSITGGTLKAAGFYIGDQSGGNGSITASGGAVQATANLIVGNASSGHLTLSNNVTLSVGGYTEIGQQSGASGTVLMNGGTWTNTGNLSVGTRGVGSIDLNGGSITANSVYVGDQDTGVGTFGITGSGSLTATNLLVGSSGKGNMTIGGYAKASTTFIGQNAGSQGSLTLGRTGASPGILETGQVNKGAGTGKLTFDGGGLRANRSNTNYLSGFSAGELDIKEGGALIDSNGSFITIQAPLQGVGGLTKKGAGSLTLSGNHNYTGATTIEAGTLTITNNSIFNSAITVNSGATLTLNIASDVKLLKGVSGPGTVNVSGNQTTARLAGDDSGFTGTFTLPSTARGMMWSNANAGSASAKWDLNGQFAFIETGVGNSTVQLGELSGTNTATELAAFGGIGVKTFQVGALGTNSSFAGSIKNITSFGGGGIGTVALNKVGTGTLTLLGTSTYTGGTTVSAGKLLVSGSITGSTSVQSAGTLGGTGSVLGDTTVAGTLAPGSSAGLLTFGGDLTLQLGSTTAIELGGTSVALFDRISVNDVLTYGGTLSLSLLNGFTPQTGDTFQLFKDFNSQSGAFSSIAFTNPEIVGNFDYSTGTLSIVAVPEASAGALISAALLGLFASRRRSRKHSSR